MPAVAGPVRRGLPPAARPLLFPALLLALQASLSLGFSPTPLFRPARLSPSAALLRSAVVPPAYAPSRRAPSLRMGSEASQGQAPSEPNIKSTARLESGTSLALNLSEALQEALRAASANLPPGPPSCCFVQVSSQYIEGGGDGEIGAQGYRAVTQLLSGLFAERGWLEVPVVGCSASGVIAGNSQTEGACNPQPT